MWLLLASAASATASQLPQQDHKIHLGVATCASGVCHGSVGMRSGSRVLQNEYVVWSRRDPHHNAYETLLTERSKSIAQKLGIADASKAKVCLDCHADNVPDDQRGEQFQISDGVGCEVCHGGAQDYISMHTDDATKRSAEIEAGLYPLDRPTARAKVCLACHLGSANKYAGHDIMGAGHPRLSFELDTFTILQPAHYVVDQDFAARKDAPNNLETWALGQVEAAQETLTLVQQKLSGKGRFPELALFDCQGCHHAMSDERWNRQSAGGLPPGNVRLNDASIVMLLPFAQVVAPGLAGELHRRLEALQLAINRRGNPEPQINSVREVVSRLGPMAKTLDTGAVAPKLLQQMLQMGAEGDFGHYVSAEQAAMAIDMLLSVTHQLDSHQKSLNGVYDTLAHEDSFDPQKFRKRVEALHKSL